VLLVLSPCRVAQRMGKENPARPAELLPYLPAASSLSPCRAQTLLSLPQLASPLLARAQPSPSAHALWFLLGAIPFAGARLAFLLADGRWPSHSDTDSCSLNAASFPACFFLRARPSMALCSDFAMVALNRAPCTRAPVFCSPAERL
jgi:hypothetical protein